MQLPVHLRKTLTVLLFFGVLIVAFWIRVQGTERIPYGQFTENDAYLYYWQASIIAEQGHLPARDMWRWLPTGRDNRQTLSSYPYTIAYIHKAFPQISIYTIQNYIPVVCFTLGIGVLCFFLSRCYGIIFAGCVGVILATLPGSIERSAIGFGDRDAWCWLFGVLAVISYLYKEQLDTKRNRYLATVLSGFVVFLGGLSWEGFGFFLLTILTIEIWMFCSTKKEEHLTEYLLFVCIFVPCLYLISPAYRSGYGFSTHLTALMLAPPIMILAMRVIRFLLLHFYQPLRPHAQKIAWSITGIAIIIGISYFFSQTHTFETTAFAFRESRFMKTMTELEDPHFIFWTARYGSVFFLGSFGIIIAILHIHKWHGIPIALALLLFVSTTFFRWHISEWIGASPCDTLFYISLGLLFLSFPSVFLRKPLHERHNEKMKLYSEQIILVMLVWFVLWVALARGGKRYDIFIGVPLAIGTAWFIWTLPAIIRQKLGWQKYEWVGAGLSIITVCLILFWTPFGAHATRAKAAITEWRHPIPGKNKLAQTLTWMDNTLTQEVVVAANWSYGSLLNTLAGVKTITDQDSFIPHWIHLYYRHVYCGRSIQEALTYLKTHKATHLMLTENGLTSKAKDYSNVGSDENSDRRFEFTELIPISNNRLSRLKHTPFLYIDAPNIESLPNFLTAHIAHGEIAQIPYTAFKENQRIANKTQGSDDTYGYVILYYDYKDTLIKAFHVSSTNGLPFAVRLFYLDDMPNIFIPVYPTNKKDIAAVKVWKIHYPTNIEINDKYLRTKPEVVNEN